MPTSRRKTIDKTIKRASNTARLAVRPTKPNPKLSRRSRADLAEVARMRAEAETAVAEARKSHERLRQAIDILPQGIVFLDADGRYILWNKKYSEIYSRSSDLFEPARGCRTPSGSASSAAIIPKRSAARKSGSPSGSPGSTSPESAMSRCWPTVAVS
jgi:hypothetical protein